MPALAASNRAALLGSTVAAGVAVPPLSQINGVGWSAEYPSPPGSFSPDSSPVLLPLSRAGYDATGSTTTYSENLVLTARVRQAYPNQASLSTSTVSLSDYVYSTDTISGVTNNSIETSPKPICGWAMPDRLIVGTSLFAEVVAFHRNARNGKQVACVVFTATDGTNTVTATVSTPAISNRTGDQNAVITYSTTLDISSLNDNSKITLNAKVYPWIGGAAAVNDSSTGGAAVRDFGPRYFRKDTTRLATPWRVYVASAGNDSTGVASTNDGTASASPCLTVGGAITKLQAAAGRVDTGTIFIVDTVTGGAPTLTGQVQGSGSLTITRASGTARASAIVKVGASSFRPKITVLNDSMTEGRVRFTDVTLQRDGSAGAFAGEAAQNAGFVFDDVSFNVASFTGGWLSNGSDYFYGVTFSNLANGTTVLSQTSAGQHRTFRGVTADLGSTGAAIDMWWVIGCNITNCAGNTYPGSGFSGAILAFNRLWKHNSNTQFCFNASDNTTGVAVVQNVFEWTTASTGTALFTNADSAKSNFTHCVIHNNTFAGFFNSGRNNMFYDDGAAPSGIDTSTRRSNRLHSFKGNIPVAVNTKGDWFVGTNNNGSPNATEAPFRADVMDGSLIANWAFLYGVGCQGNMSQYIDANSGGIGTSFAQAYPGLGCNYGTSATVRNDPLFTAYAGTTNSGSTPVAGSGGGTYTVANNSPAKSMVSNAVLPYDLAGTARSSTNDTAGAYA